MIRNPEQVRQAMQQITSNPELYRSLITSDPRFNEMPREMQEEMLQPEYLQSMSEAFSNPYFVQQNRGRGPKGIRWGNGRNWGRDHPTQAELDRVNAIFSQMSLRP